MEREPPSPPQTEYKVPWPEGGGGEAQGGGPGALELVSSAGLGQGPCSLPRCAQPQGRGPRTPSTLGSQEQSSLCLTFRVKPGEAAGPAIPPACWRQNRNGSMAYAGRAQDSPEYPAVPEKMGGHPTPPPANGSRVGKEDLGDLEEPQGQGEGKRRWDVLRGPGPRLQV